jgi:Fe-S cluster biosynthesis and repair protein YggX
MVITLSITYNWEGLVCVGVQKIAGGHEERKSPGGVGVVVKRCVSETVWREWWSETTEHRVWG